MQNESFFIAQSYHTLLCLVMVQEKPTELPPKPDNYLVWAILSTLFCCMPLGIPAIVFASQVDSKYAQGDYSGALETAQKAKIWSWIAAGTGLAGMLLYFLFMIVLVALSGSGF